MATGYSAEFGRSGAGAVNVILKSGGNQIRGNAFYFLRDDAFDRPAFQLINGVATPAPDVPSFRREQYGGTFGGPIVRDKAFYFASVERQAATIARRSSSRVPSRRLWTASTWVTTPAPPSRGNVNRSMR